MQEQLVQLVQEPILLIQGVQENVQYPELQLQDEEELMDLDELHEQQPLNVDQNQMEAEGDLDVLANQHQLQAQQQQHGEMGAALARENIQIGMVRTFFSSPTELPNISKLVTICLSPPVISDRRDNECVLIQKLGWASFKPFYWRRPSKVGPKAISKLGF